MKILIKFLNVLDIALDTEHVLRVKFKKMLEYENFLGQFHLFLCHFTNK